MMKPIVLALTIATVTAPSQAVQLLHRDYPGAVVELPNLKFVEGGAFEYGDPEREVLVGCRDGLLILIVDGGLHTLNARSFNLLEVKGGKGFKFDRRSDSVFNEPNRMKLIIRHAGVDGSKARPDTFILDFPKRSLTKVSTLDAAKSDPIGPSKTCEPMPGVKVEVEREFIRIDRSGLKK